MDPILQSRRVVISDENMGPVVSIVSIFLLILVLLAVLARLTTRFFMRRKLALEDGLVFLAALLSIGEVVAVLVQDANGLGSPIGSLSPDQLDRFQQTAYAADVLFAANLGLTKISVFLLINSLTPLKGQKIAIWINLGFTAMWTISSVFVLLFQCHVSATWQFINNQCIDRSAFWIYYTVVNVITELAIIILPMALVWNVKISRTKKALILFTFGLRIFVIIPSIFTAVYLVSASTSSDPTFAIWPAAFCGQITQTVGIITACFLQLKPFFLSLDSGLLRNDDARRRRRQGSRSASGYVSLSNSREKERQRSSRSHRAPSDAGVLLALPSRGEAPRLGGQAGAREFPWGQFEADVVEQSGSRRGASGSRSEALSVGRSASVRSVSRSGRATPAQSGVIQQTTSIAVEYEDRRAGEAMLGVAR